MTNLLGSIKDLAADTVKTGVTLPTRVAARAYGVARGAVSAGVRVVTVARQGPAPAWEDAASADAEPVNVVEELELDPAPVDPSPAAQPVTSIDAQADPEGVEVTPADVAERLSHPESP